MRLSELVGKEVINTFDGAKLGHIGESDLVINAETGAVESLILPNQPGGFNLWHERQKLVIPWQAVKRIGSQVVIIELEQKPGRLR